MNDSELRLIARLRTRRMEQDAKHGTPDHEPFVWVGVLTEEFLEFIRELLQLRWLDAVTRRDPDFGQVFSPSEVELGWQRVEDELLDLTATGLAILEDLERMKGAYPHGRAVPPEKEDSSG